MRNSGDRIKWIPLRYVIILLINKSDEREAIC